MSEGCRALRGNNFVALSVWDDGWVRSRKGVNVLLKFLLWCILLVFCWPLALALLVLFPLVWLLLLPFRLVGIAVGGVLELVRAIFFLPARMIRAL